MSPPRLLLDSHVFVWAATEPSRLTGVARAMIESGETIALSMASVWELANKIAAGKLQLRVDLATLVESGTRENLVLLAVEQRHALATMTLPPHHRDPFDRMLVAQALVEGMTLVTADRRLAAYGIPILPC